MNEVPKSFALLDTFRGLFEGHAYQHRNSTLGDLVASRLYEDLVRLGRSSRFVERVAAKNRVINVGNKAVGKKSRRGDGSLGEIVPTAIALTEDGLLVARGEIANIEIGVETKILAKAMIKQIGRVMSDLVHQVDEFKQTGGRPICVAVVGINYADVYTSYEKDRVWLTNGKKHKHPIQEAADAEKRILAKVAPAFDELQILRFKATNVEPFPFEWVNLVQTEKEYSAMLVRLSQEYDQRFA